MNCKTLLRLGLAFGVLSTTASAQVPQFGHVVLVVEENHSYSSVIGNSALPYLNSLANQYALATNFYANAHPSIGNYFMLTTGELITNDDFYKSTVGVDNIVRHLVGAGKTWKCYAESLPSVGYTGADVFPYEKAHNPFAFFTDVLNSASQQANLVPFSQFTIDLAAGNLPEYSFIVPNSQNNGEDCPAGMTICTDTDKLQNADNWLQTNIAPLVNSATFQANGLLIILFDEGGPTDNTNGGGHVAAVLVSPKVKLVGYKGSALYQHQNVLKLMASGLGITFFPPSAGFVSDMAQFFEPPTWPCLVQNNGAPAVSICSPSSGSTLTSPLRVFAVAVLNNPLTLIEVLADGAVMYQGTKDRVDTQISLTLGTHHLTVQATDSTNQTISSTILVNIAPK
jgi:phosphatidylinositol-3-phosphatase